jgi:hypothetical protein
MIALKNINFKGAFFFILLLITLNGLAQAPSLINYQGAARLDDGTPITNKVIGIRFDLHQGTSIGSIVATESQTVQTNNLGLFTTQIGKGTNLSTVNWQGGGIFLEVSIDTTGGNNYISVGTQQMVSAPYAIHAGSVPSSYTNNILTIGNSTYNISPTVVALPGTSVTVSGLGTVTSAGTNTFDINIPAPTFSNTGQQIITGTYPNFTVNTPTVPASAVPTIAITNTAAPTSSVVSSGNSFSINVPPPTFSNTGQNIITGTYPNFSVNTPTVASTSATVSQGATGIISVSNPATNSFVVSAPEPTFTPSGPVTITGTYPNLTVTSPATTPNTTVSPGAGGIVSISNPATNSFVVSVPSPTYTSSGPVTITGTYPNLTVNSTAAANATVSQGATGIISVSNPATNSFVVSAPTPTFTNSGQNIITGTYPNYVVNTPTVAANNATVSPAATGIVSVSNPATNSFVVSAPSPTFTSVGPSSITGTYPNLTITSPVSTTVSPGSGGIVSVSNPATGSFVVSVPSPTYTSSGPVTITGTYPNLTVNSTAAANATVSQGATGIISVSNPATNSFVVSAPSPTFTSVGPSSISGTYPNLTITSPVSTTVSPGSTGIVTVSNPSTGSFVVSAQTPTFTNSGQNIITGTYPNYVVNTPTVATNNATVSPGATGIVTVSNPATNSFVVSAPSPTFTSVGPSSISGTYPNLTITSPTVPPTTSVNAGSGGIISVSNPATNSFVVSAPQPTFTSVGSTSITGTHPNYTITSPSPVSPTVTGTGLASVTPTSGTSFVVDVPLLTYTPSTGALASGTNSVSILQTLSLSGTTLTSGPASNAVNLSAISPWTQGAGSVTLATSSNKVGIGTNAPAEDLQIERSTGSAGVSILAASGQISDLSFGVSSGTHFMGNIRYDHSTNSMNFWTNNTANRLVIDNNGSVGIGTAAPSGNFHLKSSGTSVLHRISSTGAVTGLVTYADNLSAALLNYESTPLYFGTSGANRMVITSGGSVGINIMAPTAMFHVVGSTRLVDGNQGAGKVLTSDASGNATWQTPTSGWGLSGNAATSTSTNFIGTTDGVPLKFRVNNVASGTIDQLAFNAFFGYQSGAAITTGSLNAGVGHTALAANTTGIMNAAIGYRALNANTNGNGNAAVGSDALLLNSSGIFNVGVGLNAARNNTSGGQNVAIGKDALTSNSTGSGNVGIGYQAGMAATGGGNVFIGNSAGSAETGSNKLYIANASGTPLIYGDFANDNVGINTTTLNAALAVDAGSITTRAGIHLTNARDQVGSAMPFQIDLVTSGQTFGTSTYGRMMRLYNKNSGQIYDMGIGSNDGFFIAIGNNYSPAAVNISSLANVGIGNSSPNAPLQFANTIVNRKIVLWEGANNDHQFYGLGINGSLMRYQVDATTADHAFYSAVNSTTSQELMRIAGTGNVGIGTTGPSYKLDIVGTGGPRMRVYSQDGFYAGLLSQNNTRQFFMGIQAISEAADGTNSGFHICDNTAGVRRLVIDYVGRTGINTSSPTATLHVNGTMKLVDGTQGTGKVLTSDASGNASWQAASKVRSITMAPGDFNSANFQGGVAFATVGGWTMPCLQFPDGNASSYAIITVVVPSDWAGGNFTCKLLYSSPNTAGNFAMSLYYVGIAAGANVSQGQSGFPATIGPSPTSDYLQEATISIVSPAAGSKALNFMVWRNGTSGSDTNTGVLNVYGVKLEYND